MRRPRNLLPTINKSRCLFESSVRNKKRFRLESCRTLIEWTAEIGVSRRSSAVNDVAARCTRSTTKVCMVTNTGLEWYDPQNRTRSVRRTPRWKEEQEGRQREWRSEASAFEMLCCPWLLRSKAQDFNSGRSPSACSPYAPTECLGQEGPSGTRTVFLIPKRLSLPRHAASCEIPLRLPVRNQCAK